MERLRSDERRRRAVRLRHEGARGRDRREDLEELQTELDGRALGADGRDTHSRLERDAPGDDLELPLRPPSALKQLQNSLHGRLATAAFGHHRLVCVEEPFWKRL